MNLFERSQIRFFFTKAKLSNMDDNQICDKI